MTPEETGDRRRFLAGLFLLTLATLVLEVLDTRLLSVLTWYHLSFVAVSLALFGLAAGGLYVYLAGDRLQGEAARRALAVFAALFALSVPVSHVLLLQIPLRLSSVRTSFLAAALQAASAVLLLAVPFTLAGVVIGLALTRIPCPIGLSYGADLTGAAAGCLVALPLLTASDVSTATFAVGLLASGAAVLFLRPASPRSQRFAITGLAAMLIVLTGLQALGILGVRVRFTKGERIPWELVRFERWNGHSQVLAGAPVEGPPFYWGPGTGASRTPTSTIKLLLDGSAETYVTRWDGDPSALDWVRHDVTSLPYHLRRGGDVAVLGAGGGRDALTALWAGSRSVTAVELNDALIDFVLGPAEAFAGLARTPSVRFVHDDARSFLARSPDRYDVVQMSLIDSWTATTAGAFTLSENGLYTREAWRTFLGKLKPAGVFSVSRWFSQTRISETTRLLALAVAALHDRGVADAGEHVALVARQRIATLLVSPTPFSDADRAVLARVAADEGFSILVEPGRPPSDGVFRRTLASRTEVELREALADDLFDFSPPSDERPYFFNILRPRGMLAGDLGDTSGVVRGNLAATAALCLLVAVCTVLVLLVILLPLAVGARLDPPARRAFGPAVAYFAAIGAGFMLIQIAFVQRFSVFLGHPTYALVVILCSMILFAGLGSLLSERLRLTRTALVAVPLAIAGLVLLSSWVMQPVIEGALSLGLATRALVVLAFTAPLSLGLGCCFPAGMRLLANTSPRLAPWAWGVNGACGVLASSLAVALSMFSGIHTSLYLASALYAFLAIPALILSRRGSAPPPVPVP